MNERVNGVDIDGEQQQGTGQLYTPRPPYSTLGTFTAASTTLGVTARAVADVSDSTSVQTYDVPAKTNAIKLQFTGTADTDVNIYDIFFATGDTGHYTRAATVTATVGTQTSPISGEEFASQVAVSNERWGSAFNATSADDDYIGEVKVDLENTDRVAVQCTTLGSNGSVLVSGY